MFTGMCRFGYSILSAASSLFPLFVCFFTHLVDFLAVMLFIFSFSRANPSKVAASVRVDETFTSLIPFQM